MNSIEELENMGIERENAIRMLEAYEKHIGERHGDYVITDMIYLGNKERDVKLTCSTCGYVRHKHFKNTKNKLSELATICPECQKERALMQKAIEKEQELKKAYERVGEVHGDYLITGAVEGSYTCECVICHATRTISIFKLDSWKTSTCTKHYVQDIKYDESYIGKKNNRLKVLGITKNKANKKVFLCKCDCGNTTLVQPIIWATGKVKSCGCFQETRSISANEEKRILGIYRGMKRRCYCPDDRSYAAYGGRGIKICDEWLNDKNKFLEWSLLNGYSNTLTIDRIDVNGDYSPKNCRWATYKQQYANMRPRKRGKSAKTNR